MSATAERNRVAQAAPTDCHKALELARKVSQPWFRCQALAEVARYAPEGDVARVASEAVKTAMQDTDAYRRVCLAWPLRALVERGKSSRAEALAGELLPQAAGIAHPVNRMDALALLWPATQGLSHPIRQAFLEALLSACSAARSWKAGRTLRDVVGALVVADGEQARRVASAMPEGAYKRQAARLLDAPKGQQ